MRSFVAFSLVFTFLLQNVCCDPSYTYSHNYNVALTLHDDADPMSSGYAKDTDDKYDDPCGNVDYLHPNATSYTYNEDLRTQISYRNKLEKYQASIGLVPYLPEDEYPKKKRYEKTHLSYFRIAPRSIFPPVYQKTFLIRRPQTFIKYIVNAHDFNKNFHDVVYVSDEVSLDSPEYLDYDVQLCSPCNRHFNRSYWSYSDFSGRYVSCDLTFMYPDREFKVKPHPYGKCKNDVLYEKICNPCERKHKVVNVPVIGPDHPPIKLRLPFEEIVQLGVPFWDKYNNVYEFMSLTDYNVQFDDKYGNPLPSNYDNSHVYKYYKVKKQVL